MSGEPEGETELTDDGTPSKFREAVISGSLRLPEDASRLMQEVRWMLQEHQAALVGRLDKLREEVLVGVRASHPAPHHAPRHSGRAAAPRQSVACARPTGDSFGSAAFRATPRSSSAPSFHSAAFADQGDGCSSSSMTTHSVSHFQPHDPSVRPRRGSTQSCSRDGSTQGVSVKQDASNLKHEVAFEHIHDLVEGRHEPQGPLARAYRKGHRTTCVVYEDLTQVDGCRQSLARPEVVLEDKPLAEAGDRPSNNPQGMLDSTATQESDCESEETKTKRTSGRRQEEQSDQMPMQREGTMTRQDSSSAYDEWRRSPCSWRWLTKVGKSPCFDLVSGAMVMVNAVLIGVETEYMTHFGGRSHNGFIVMQLTLNIWFMLELGLRLLSDHCRFFSTPDWSWNLFDAVLVGFSIVDVVQVAVTGMEGVMVAGRLMRIIRLSRVVRTLRLCRTLTYFHQFRKMVYSLQSSMTTLLWSLLLLFAVMFAFSVLFVQGVAEFLNDGSAPMGEPYVTLLRSEYGSLFRGCVTLYKAISNGVSWGDIMEPLGYVDPTFIVLFLVYISISFFGVLNVVSAVFVESAMASAAHYKDLRIFESRKAKSDMVKHMRDVFKQIDEDESGEISFEEMDHFLLDPQLRMYVESLEVTVEDTAMLFQLMDTDDSGVVDIEEFCAGLLKLQGDARSFDVHLLIFEVSKLQKRWDKFVLYVQDMLDEICDGGTPLRGPSGAREAGMGHGSLGSGRPSHFVDADARPRTTGGRKTRAGQLLFDDAHARRTTRAAKALARDAVREDEI